MSVFIKNLEIFKSQKLAILIDDNNLAPRAVYVSPAQTVTEQQLNYILSRTGGLPFVALSPQRTDRLELAPMPQSRLGNSQLTHNFELAALVSVEARQGVTTGISIADRVCTIRLLGDKEPSRKQLVSPGHIFPVAAREGGVLVRSAIPEGALDLVVVAGFNDAALFVDVLNDSGEELSVEEIENRAKEENLALFRLSEIIRHRLEHESLVERVAETRLPTKVAGEFKSLLYRSVIHDGEHIALVKGDLECDKPVLTRVQAEFTFGDVFGGSNPPTRQMLHSSMKAIETNGSGVVLYLRRAVDKELRAQVSGWRERFNTPPAAIMREYGLGSQILRDLGIRKIRLLTNSKKKLIGITSFGIEIIATESIEI